MIEKYFIEICKIKNLNKSDQKPRSETDNLIRFALTHYIFILGFCESWRLGRESSFGLTRLSNILMGEGIDEQQVAYGGAYDHQSYVMN